MSGKLTAEQVRGIIERNSKSTVTRHMLSDAAYMAIADELNATLGDEDYERKMDALLCRLTNGKFSKSRAYDLDFMESCVNYEFELLYSEGEVAE